MTWTSAQLRRLSLWLLCVMLLGALAPTVSRARAWSQGSAVPWMAVCTTAAQADPVLGLSGAAQNDEAPLPGAATLDHCALCVLATDRMAPPSTPWAWQARPQAPPRWVPFDLPASEAVLHWTVRSRAPPAHA